MRESSKVVLNLIVHSFTLHLIGINYNFLFKRLIVVMQIYILFFLILCIILGQEYSLLFIETPSNITAVSGNTILLKCKVQIKPENIRYNWKHNGAPLISSSRKQIINGSLLINHINETQDAGDYICESENIVSGERISSEAAKVVVNRVPNEASVVLIEPKEVSHIHSTREMILECQTSGSDLYISWFRNGERITKSEHISIEGNRVGLKNLSSKDNGVFRCVASNIAGSVNSLKNFALSVADDGQAIIKVTPEDKIVKEGASVRIDCAYTNADVIEWYFQEAGPQKNSTRFTILVNGSLIVNSMTKKDEGIYSCVGIKEDSPAVPQKYTAQLYVSTLGAMNYTFLEPHDPSSHIVAEGNNFEIQCFPPVGNPSPTISWRNTKSDVIGTSGRIKVQGHKLLINKAIRSTDSGRYNCRAENVAGFREISFILVVAVPPVIKKHPVSQRVNEESDVTFTCEFTGVSYPFTQVLWYKDEISISMNTTRTYVNIANGTLKLANVELSDAGNYYCLVNTSSVWPPIKSRIAALNIDQKLKFHPLPMGKKMELGITNKIPCKAEGKDIPVVKWIKGNSMDAPSLFPKHVQDLNGILFFNNVLKSDEGQYMCIANNSQGEIRVVINVDVVVTPKFTILPKNLTEGYEGFPLMLDCAAEGDPSPTIQWDSKNVDLNQRRFRILPNGSLLIDELHLSDEGNFGCTAGNSGGFNRTEVTLIVRNSDILGSDGTMDGIEGDNVGKTVFITLGAACAYILLVVILMAWCRYRRRKKKQSYMEANIENTHLDDNPDAGKYNSENFVELKETVIVQNGESHCVLDEGSSSHSITSPSRLSTDICDSLNFSRKNIHNIMLLGKGEFGSVYLGRNSRNNNAVVMVKVLEDITDEFNRQLDVLTRVSHENVIRLVGLCREMKPHYMTLEYTDWGDLKQFLIATRKSSIGEVGNKERPAPLTINQSLVIIKQAINALQSIAEKNCTHRDVAARNCLITSSLNVKITFSSLCKTIYASDYYLIRHQLMPLRWLPLEAIAENNFTVTTDVYSFGCLIWEIFTKAELPFSKLSNKEFLNLLEKQQVQWKLPKSMPAQLGQLVYKCWSLSPTDRPSFVQIREEIKSIF